MTSGVSPLALTKAHADWAQHLLLSPDKQIELVHKAARKWARFFSYCSHASIDPGWPVCIEPLPQDYSMARDGLLPPFAAIVHPRFRPPMSRR